MHKIDTPYNHDGQFVDRDDVNGVHGTFVDADFLNAVQDELCNVVTAAKMNLSKTNVHQVRDAIRVLAKGVAQKNVVSASHSDVSLASSAGFPMKIAGFYKMENQFVDVSFDLSVLETGSRGNLILELVGYDSEQKDGYVQRQTLAQLPVTAVGYQTKRLMINPTAMSEDLPSGFGFEISFDEMANNLQANLDKIDVNINGYYSAV